MMHPQRNAPQRDLHQYHRERETLARRGGYLMSSERGGSSRRENPRHAPRRKAAAARRLQPRPSRSRANPAQSAASRPHASATSIHAAPRPIPPGGSRMSPAPRADALRWTMPGTPARAGACRAKGAEPAPLAPQPPEARLRGRTLARGRSARGGRHPVAAAVRGRDQPCTSLCGETDPFAVPSSPWVGRVPPVAGWPPAR